MAIAIGAPTRHSVAVQLQIGDKRKFALDPRLHRYVLVQEAYKHPVGPFEEGWLFPMGKIRRGETPELAALRVLREYTGIVLPPRLVTGTAAVPMRRESRDGRLMRVSVFVPPDWEATKLEFDSGTGLFRYNELLQLRYGSIHPDTLPVLAAITTRVQDWIKSHTKSHPTSLERNNHGEEPDSDEKRAGHPRTGGRESHEA